MHRVPAGSFRYLSPAPQLTRYHKFITKEQPNIPATHTSFVVARLLAPIDSLLRARAAALLTSSDVGWSGRYVSTRPFIPVTIIYSCLEIPIVLWECLKPHSAMGTCSVTNP